MLKLYHLEHEGIEGYGDQFIKLVNSGLIEGSNFPEMVDIGACTLMRLVYYSAAAIAPWVSSHRSDAAHMPRQRLMWSIRPG